MSTESEIKNRQLQEQEQQAAREHMTTQGGFVRNLVEWAMMGVNGGEFGKGKDARMLRRAADAVDIAPPPPKVPFFTPDEKK